MFTNLVIRLGRANFEIFQLETLRQLRRRVWPTNDPLSKQTTRSKSPKCL